MQKIIQYFEKKNLMQHKRKRGHTKRKVNNNISKNYWKDEKYKQNKLI